MSFYDIALRVLGSVPPYWRDKAARIGSAAAVKAGYRGAVQLQNNLRRGGEEGVVEALGRYYNYFADLGNFAAASQLKIDAAVTASVPSQLYSDLKRGPVCVALGHCANWDLIGAWAATNLAPLTTVAEVVSPRALFDTFVRLRSRNHMNIVPAQKGRPVFGELLARARKGRGIFALLADRDITGAGIEVELFGQKALVAAGPAALAKQANLPLYVAVADQITLRGARLRAAGTKNGAELVVRGPIKVSDSVEETTQAWVDAFARELRPRLKSWHMCQPLFVSDLDPVRLARSRKKHEQMEKQS